MHACLQNWTEKVEPSGFASVYTASKQESAKPPSMSVIMMDSVLGTPQRWLGELQEQAGVWQSLAATLPSFFGRPPWQTCKHKSLDEPCNVVTCVVVCSMPYLM